MIKSDIYIQNINSLSQYYINNKLITIFGEKHFTTNMPCHLPKMYINDIINEFFTLPIVLLEILPGTILKKYHSINIRNIIKMDSLQYIGFDYRRQFIPSDILYYLSNHNKLKLIDFMTFFYSSIPNAMDLSFAKKKEFILKLDTNQNILLDNLLIDMINDIHIINNSFKPSIDFALNLNTDVLLESFNKKGMFIQYKDIEFCSLINLFHIFWNKFIEYFMLFYIFTTDNNNIIILVGEDHLINLNNLLNDQRIYPKLNIDIISKYENCININGMYVY